MPSQGELFLFLREKIESRNIGASKRYGAFYFLRLTNRSIVASPNERNEVGLGEGELIEFEVRGSTTDFLSLQRRKDQ